MWKYLFPTRKATTTVSHPYSQTLLSAFFYEKQAIDGSTFEVKVASAVSASKSKLVGPGITDLETFITNKTLSYFAIETFDAEGKPTGKGIVCVFLNLRRALHCLTNTDILFYLRWREVRSAHQTTITPLFGYCVVRAS